MTFGDVAGCDQSKQELFEVVEFLKNPAKFAKVRLFRFPFLCLVFPNNSFCAGHGCVS